MLASCAGLVKSADILYCMYWQSKECGILHLPSVLLVLLLESSAAAWALAEASVFSKTIWKQPMVLEPSTIACYIRETCGKTRRTS